MVKPKQVIWLDSCLLHFINLKAAVRFYQLFTLMVEKSLIQLFSEEAIFELESLFRGRDEGQSLLMY